MKRLPKVLLLSLPVLILLGICVWYVATHNMQVLNPGGPIGFAERRLIYLALGLAIVVVIPVFVLLATFAWKYRAGNTKAGYSPEWDHNRIVETVWWLIPSVLILILGIATWKATHVLDPYQPLHTATTKPLTIQVVALDWKWLFIYPEQHIASVNEVHVPINTPISFQLTADAPMNSFWVPQLGGQVYAMPGMSTQLHLQADHQGSFSGNSANISGKGFAGMKFTTIASSKSDFDAWVRHAKASSKLLNPSSYAALAAPSENQPASLYGSADSGLYETIIAKYMAPQSPTMQTMPHMEGM